MKVERQLFNNRILSGQCTCDTVAEGLSILRCIYQPSLLVLELQKILYNDKLMKATRPIYKVL